MLIALFSILVLIWVVYFQREEKKSALSPNWLRKNWRILVLTGMAILPFAYMNVFHSNGRKLTLDERLQLAKEEGTRADVIEASADLIYQYRDSIPLYFGYSDARRIHNNQTCPIVEWSDFTHDQEIIGIAQEYHIARCRGDLEELFEKGRHDFDLSKRPYANYVRALRAKMLGEYPQAASHLLAEIKVNPTFDASYKELFELYSIHMPEKVSALMEDPAFRAHIPGELQQMHFFTHGKIGNYLAEVFDERYLQIDPWAFFAGLAISLIWLIYLRSLDIFRKERWINLLLVFIGGVFFAILCLPLYDLAYFFFDFDINGESLNDFLYCVLVIGGSEELVKLLPWIIFALLTRKLREPFDYLLYASMAALGFAFAENWSYLEDPGNILGRFLTSTVAHLFSASIFAYSVVLARFRYQHRSAKILAPIIGYILACVAHGFYDFWLISPAANGMELVSIPFLLAAIHIWFHLKNNAINQSQFYRHRIYHYLTPLNVLMFGVIGILMVEYVSVSHEHGARWANSNLRRESWMAAFFLIYMGFNLRNIKPVQGVWQKYRLPTITRIPDFLSLGGTKASSYDDSNFEGLKLRLFTPKSNPYIGEYFPVSGTCAQQLTISDYDGWYLFKLHKALDLPNYRNDAVIIRPKNMHETLDEEKIELYLLLIPQGLLLLDGMEVEQFRYPGKVFSLPI